MRKIVFLVLVIMYNNLFSLSSNSKEKKQNLSENRKENYENILEIAENLKKINPPKCLNLLDEVILKLSKDKENYLLAKAYLLVTETYLIIPEYDNVDKYIKKTNTISIENNYIDLLAKNNKLKGDLFYDKSEYEKAMFSYLEALNLYEKIGDRAGMGPCCTNIGIIKTFFGEKEESAKYFNKSIEIYAGDRDSINIIYPYLGLGNLFLYYNEVDKALDYYHRIYNIAQNNDEVDQIEVLNNMGSAYIDKGELLKAITYFHKCLVICTKFDDKNTIASTNFSIGNVYFKMGLYEKAVKYYQKSLEIQIQTKDEYGILLSKLNIGLVSLKGANSDVNLEYLDDVIKLSNQMDIHHAKSNVYSNLSDYYLRIGELDKAISYADSCQEISEKLSNSSEIITSFLLKSQIFEKSDDYEEAYKWCNLALKESYKTNDDENICIANIAAARLFINEDKLSEAEKNLNRIQDRIVKISDDELYLSVYKLFSEIYEKKNQKDLAIYYLKKYTDKSDSLRIKKNQDELASLRYDNQLDKKISEVNVQRHGVIDLENDISQTEKKNIILILFLLLLLMIILLIIFLYKSKKNAEKRASHLLSTILPQHTFSEMKELGVTKPSQFRNATICCIDIVDFTKTSSSISSTLLLKEINEIFSEFDKIFSKHGCDRVKTSGDEYIAISGSPEKIPDISEQIIGEKRNLDDYAKNIIIACNEVINYLKKRNIESSLKWELRIGVNSGDIIGAIIGIKKIVYDVFGETVELASMIESGAKKMQVTISQSTYELVKNSFDLDFYNSITFKKRRINLYYVIDD